METRPWRRQSAAGFLRIDYPNYYTDWEATVGHTILWHSYNVSGNVTIQLYDSTGTMLLATIADVAASQGSYGWSPQASGIAGDSSKRYLMRITADSTPAVSTTSREQFSVPTASPNYFINDSVYDPNPADHTGDEYTTAAGSNRNTGTTSGDPKANLIPLLKSYNPGPGDTVFIDTGYYIEVRNVVLSGNLSIGTGAGATFTGPLSHTATLDRGNTYSYATNIELNDAGSVTMSHLTLEDAGFGLWLHNQSIRFNGTYLTVANNSSDGMRVESDSSQSTFGYLTAYGNGGDGINISTAIASLSNCTAYGNSTGIYVYNSSSGSPTIVGNPSLSTDPTAASGGNLVYNNSSGGIYAQGNVVTEGNTVYGQTRGSGYGIFVISGATAQQNVVHDNATGIYIVLSGQALNNRVYNNSQAGIYVGYGTGVVTGNTLYSNSVGVDVEGSQATAQLSNNLIYANTNQGVLLYYAINSTLINNTIYQPVGDAVDVQNSSSNVLLNNNILWTQATGSYDINVSSDSQSGFVSDYNDLMTTAAGQVALWQGIARPTLAAWQNTALDDQNSLALDPLFVNVAGADFHLQSLYGSYHGGSNAPAISTTTGLPYLLTGTWTADAAQSPGIDTGDPSTPYANEPDPNGGYVNLGSDGNTNQASKSPVQFVLVTKPSGGEVWPEGQTFPIRWRYHLPGDPGGSLVNIDLYQLVNNNPVFVQNIVTNAPNSGEYDWTLPTTIAPAANYLVQVTRLPHNGDGTTLVGISPAAFTIAPPQYNYYVDDPNKTVFDSHDWTTAAGNDANSGLDPAHPKASIAAVLNAYPSLGANATIWVDDGNYMLGANITIAAAHSGLRIVGYNATTYPPTFAGTADPTRRAVVNRGNTSSGEYVFQMTGAQNATLDHLSITGGYDGVEADSGVNRAYLTLSNSTIYGNSQYGVYLNSSNTNALVTGNTVYGSSTGIYLYGTQNAADSNTVYQCSTGIYVNGSGSGTANQNRVTNNTVHDNSYQGISLYYNALAQGQHGLPADERQRLRHLYLRRRHGAAERAPRQHLWRLCRLWRPSP